MRFLFGGDPVTTESRKLILEYRAIQRIDQILQQSGTIHETELIGLTARVIRRQEILRELTARVKSRRLESPPMTAL